MMTQGKVLKLTFFHYVVCAFLCMSASALPLGSPENNHSSVLGLQTTPSGSSSTTVSSTVVPPGTTPALQSMCPGYMVSKVHVQLQSDAVRQIAFEYRDGTLETVGTPGTHTEVPFILDEGEVIVQVNYWANICLHGFQIVTNTGRASKYYGASCGVSCLSVTTASAQNPIVRPAQVGPTKCSQPEPNVFVGFGARLFEQPGGQDCSAAVLESPEPLFSCDSMKVSKVHVKLNWIFKPDMVSQVTYEYRDGSLVTFGDPSPQYAIDAETFVLAEDEVIVRVQSQSVDDECMYGFSMTTNLGRVSQYYGRHHSLPEEVSEASTQNPVVYRAFGSGEQGDGCWGIARHAFSGRGARLLEHSRGRECYVPERPLLSPTDQLLVAGTRVRLCPASRHRGYCLHVGADPTAEVYLSRDDAESPDYYLGSLWEILRPWGSEGPWFIRSALHPTYWLHVGGDYHDVRVWPDQSRGSMWTISELGTDSNTQQSTFAIASRRPEHAGKSLHVTEAGLAWRPWHLPFVWEGFDGGSIWNIERVEYRV